MRDMSKVYAHLSDEQLQKRRDRAAIELYRLEAGKSLWNDRDRRELTHIIHQIDVEKTYRMHRQALPLDFS